jgi:hypothetical protein
MAQARLAILRPNQRTVVHDHRYRAADFSRHGQGKIVASSGNERNLNPPAGRFYNSGSVRLRHFPSAVQKRAVNIQRNQTHGHTHIVP